MTSAIEFLLEVRSLVEPLHADRVVCELIELALNEHNQEMLDIACSPKEHTARVGMVVRSRNKLIYRLEDIAELWLKEAKG